MMMAGELLEREAERAVLASAVRRVAAGDGAGLVMVLGEAGIGKTALLAVAGGLAQELASGRSGPRGRRSSVTSATGWYVSCLRGSCVPARRRSVRCC